MGFFDSFTGASQKRAIADANAQATKFLNDGYDTASAALNKGYGEAQGYLDPYVTEGRSDQAMYRKALGLNGADGSTTAMNAYQRARNPYADFQADQTTNALMRNYNARGMGMGGTAALAAARANNEQGYGDYQNWLGRIGNLGQQGYGASQASAGMSAQKGSQLADLGWNFNSAKAGNAVNYGNALASASGIGVNNLFNALGLGTKIASAAMGVPTR